MTELISPVAIGLISDPPTIVVSYDCISSGEGKRRKRRKRKMPLRDFTDRSNVKRYAFNLRQRHTKYLADVLDVTLEKMLRMIQEIQKGNSVERSLEIVNKEYSIDPNEDLNKLSPALLAQRKAVMDEIFRKNLVKPDDPNFVYDREMTFELKNGKGEGNDWDEDESEKAESKNLSSNQIEARVPTVIANKNENLSGEPSAVRTHQIDNGISTENVPGVDNNKSTDQLLASFAEVHNPSSSNLENSVAGKASQEQDEESSSNNDLEEALVNIESGALDEEDEDFWA